MHSPAKDRLLTLESSGQYVFHGSARGDISVLEPRQAFHFINVDTDTEEKIMDGSPAVSATPYLEIGIFRAIMNSDNIQSDSATGFGMRDGKPTFNISSGKVLDEVKDKGGFVYVFSKKDFEPYSRNGDARPESMEWRCYKSMQPIEAIEVNFNDLPAADTIKITNSDK